MHEKKKTLRKAVCALNAPTSKDAASACAINIARVIERLPEFSRARTVALYHALPDELPTEALLERWHGTKRLALPVIEKGENGANATMTFREYTGTENLRKGAFGILEPHNDPDHNNGPEIPSQQIDLMLVPGVAFDRGGKRLGRGKGFYDRYLSRPDAAHIYKIGVCLPHRLLPEVPSEPHDITMDKIVTDNE